MQSWPAQIAHLAKASAFNYIAGKQKITLDFKELQSSFALFARLALSARKPAFPSGNSSHESATNSMKKRENRWDMSRPNSSSDVVAARLMSVRMPSVENSTKSSSATSRPSLRNSDTSQCGPKHMALGTNGMCKLYNGTHQTAYGWNQAIRGFNLKHDPIGLLFPFCLIKMTGLAASGTSCCFLSIFLDFPTDLFWILALKTRIHYGETPTSLVKVSKAAKRLLSQKAAIWAHDKTKAIWPNLQLSLSARDLKVCWRI